LRHIPIRELTARNATSESASSIGVVEIFARYDLFDIVHGNGIAYFLKIVLIISSSICLNRRDEIGNPQNSLANPPDTPAAQKQFNRAIHVANLEMISIGYDIDRDADASGQSELSAGAVDGLDQPSAEFLGVFKIERNQAG
jgi:hypothetical protein